MSCFLEVVNASYLIKKKIVLQDINIKLYNNEFVSLIGHNGSGKTTLGKLLVGILKARYLHCLNFSPFK